ncbi:MAG: thioredoxin domain-containing protein [Flavobacteriaceae bacterium]|nr:thioredoxin domain-containing protein [Flavobacteriaceae bacterium]
MKSLKNTNSLINETSPYLLQHAHNPVNWYSWSDEILARAKEEQKLLLISIGYSSCHWCHVMEHESFEDETVAELMNAYFINIKVDREERPDLDQIYMNAVQLITGSGGWPLNCIALPDGRPIWGGTYFKKEAWKQSLYQIAELHRTNPEKVIAYAEKLTLGVQQSGLITLNTKPATFTKAFVDETVKKWSIYFDDTMGGTNRVPKFPMPNNYHFLLRYGYQYNNDYIKKYINTTLTKIALGGIFDHVNGGFSRYSVDAKWHIPHFEKMLYDNGQLVSLYADAFLITKDDLYKDTVYNTLTFIENELLDVSGGFYTALDADSLNETQKLEEGAYYVFTKSELQQLIKTHFKLFSAYYNINSYGYWEDDKYHLIKTETNKEFAKKYNLQLTELENYIDTWQQALYKARKQRPYPRLDDKILTSWNGIMLKGYIDAYRVFNREDLLTTALKNAQFIEQNVLKEDSSLYHTYKKNTATVTGYLEDYATIIDAFIALYEVTINEKWLLLAKNLADMSFDLFFDSKSRMFFFTTEKDATLIARKMEVEDNVIPSSNSIMAKNLFKLSRYFNNQYYYKTSTQMLSNIVTSIQNYGAAYSNWLDLYSNFTDDFFEIAVCGQNAKEIVKELQKVYIPNKLICASTTKSNLPLLKNRYVENKTFIYICIDNTCLLPTESIEVAINQLKKIEK